MDMVDICVISFLSVLVILFFLVIFCFKCMTKKSKGTGDNPGGCRTGGGGVNPDVTFAAVGVNGGMTVGCACGTDGSNGVGGGEGSACCGGGGGDVNPGVTLTAVGVNGGMTVGCACGTGGGNSGGGGSACCGGGGCEAGLLLYASGVPLKEKKK